MAAKRSGRRAAGELEGEVLTALHAAAAPMTPGEVQRVLAGDLAYTTVLTILARLHTKGILRRVPAGRGYAYCPAQTRVEFMARQMRGLLDLGGSERAAVLAQFVGELAPGDEELLHQLLAEHGKPAGG